MVGSAPAASLGISTGDVITAVDGAPINSATAMADALNGHHPGDVISVTWQTKSGGTRTGNVTLAEDPGLISSRIPPAGRPIGLAPAVIAA